EAAVTPATPAANTNAPAVCNTLHVPASATALTTTGPVHTTRDGRVTTRSWNTTPAANAPAIEMCGVSNSAVDASAAAPAAGGAHRLPTGGRTPGVAVAAIAASADGASAAAPPPTAPATTTIAVIAATGRRRSTANSPPASAATAAMPATRGIDGSGSTSATA